MNFFRKFRVRFLKEGKFAPYLSYALGEIVLVVIGILIAVSINNWDQSRKENENFEKVVQIVIQDIKSDLNEIKTLNDFYSNQKVVFEMLMNESMTDSVFINTKGSNSLITYYEPFNIEKRGYSLLKGFPDDIHNMKDSNVVKLLENYAYFIEINRINSELLNSNIERNIVEMVHKYPWFSEVAQRKYPKEYLDYVLHDPIFRNKVCYHYALVYHNYLPLLSQFEEEMTSVMNQIKNRN